MDSIKIKTRAQIAKMATRLQQAGAAHHVPQISGSIPGALPIKASAHPHLAVPMEEAVQ